MVALQDELTVSQSQKEMQAAVKPAQLALELHGYVQEANWAFKLLDDKSALLLARRAMADRIAARQVSESSGNPEDQEKMHESVHGRTPSPSERSTDRNAVFAVVSGVAIDAAGLKAVIALNAAVSRLSSKGRPLGRKSSWSAGKLG
jgi:hypothetical protein